MTVDPHVRALRELLAADHEECIAEVHQRATQPPSHPATQPPPGALAQKNFRHLKYLAAAQLPCGDADDQPSDVALTSMVAG